MVYNFELAHLADDLEAACLRLQTPYRIFQCDVIACEARYFCFVVRQRGLK